jgi:glycosyltransferase involved in cell wall biosynthesis
MQALARELRLRRVTFAGELAGEAKWRAYGTAELFVLPTRSENFGLAIAEALAAGTPVVTTQGAPWAGLLHHRCGWWVADADAELEAAMQQAMATPRTELAVMGLRGREWVQSEFSWTRVAEMMAATYGWLLGRTDRPDWIVH